MAKNIRDRDPYKGTEPERRDKPKKMGVRHPKKRALQRMAVYLVDRQCPHAKLLYATRRRALEAAAKQQSALKQQSRERKRA